MDPRINHALKHLGLAATVVFIASAVGFGAALKGYSHVLHPVDLLGGIGLPHGLAFNLLGLVLPGVLAGVVAMDLRRRLPHTAPWTVKIGAQLLFLSALGFIALGLLPLDIEDLNNHASRLHATAWMLWWVAFVAGAGLLAWGLRGQPQWTLLAAISRVAALGVLVMVLFGVSFLPGGIAQRLAYGLWLLWLCVAARAAR
ncbi:DUF998 domain-containing protein [Pseudoxanthomonas dokdonensis]|uniref:DUF998 domain-containing protein n=1 Tax=Pseudoxanthomonas dokdonensis TaxID=344882 RepID=UPI001FE16C73|nr:DUF998 domain-containing protein [Pseudoxanthomonas dokdonensis]